MTLTATSGLLAAGVFAHPAGAAAAPVAAGAFSSTTSGWETTAAGTVTPFGGAASYGSLEGPLNSPIITMAATPGGHGYWLVASDGGIFTFGDAPFLGSQGGHHLNRPIVGMAPTPDGHGYWLVASDGGIFTFGDAPFLGSQGGHHLNEAIVGMAATPDGHGYWLVASDGGIFTFGDAPFLGSEGGHHLNRPILGMAATADGHGYWLVASDGGIFTFGDAPFLGSLGSRDIPSPILGIGPGPGNSGYRLMSTDGSYYDFVPGGPTDPVAVPEPGASNPIAGTSGWPTSIFSTPLNERVSAASSSSAAYSQALVADYQNNYGAVGVNQLPVLTVGADQPMVKVTPTPGCNDFTADTGSLIPIPAGATTTSSDDPLVVYQPSSGTDWELWRASPAGNGSWTACWGGKLSTANSDGVFPAPFGISASGISYLATTISEADLAAGTIRHALAVDLPRCNAPQVAPADRTDCGSDPGQPPEGTWFRLPSSLPMPAGLTQFGKEVFTALQTYGMVVTDQAGAVMLQAEDTSDWQTEGHSGTDPMTLAWDGEPEYAVLNGIPWSKLQVIAP